MGAAHVIWPLAITLILQHTPQVPSQTAVDNKAASNNDLWHLKLHVADTATCSQGTTFPWWIKGTPQYRDLLEFVSVSLAAEHYVLFGR